MKKESFCTVFVTVRVVPRPLCFCFFFTTLTVTFFPLFHVIGQLNAHASPKRHQQRVMTKGNHAHSNHRKGKRKQPTKSHYTLLWYAQTKVPQSTDFYKKLTSSY